MTPSTHQQLRIFTQYDSETGEFELVCTDDRMRPMPMGPRIFRAPPHPDVKFRHETLKEAEAAAGVIRTYLANLTPKRQTKKELREYQ